MAGLLCPVADAAGQGSQQGAYSLVVYSPTLLFLPNLAGGRQIVKVSKEHTAVQRVAIAAVFLYPTATQPPLQHNNCWPQARARKPRAGGRKAVRFEEEDEEEEEQEEDAEVLDASPPATQTKSRALRALRRGGMGGSPPPMQAMETDDAVMTSPGGAMSGCHSDVETEITQALPVRKRR